ncbi:MAG: hypothetical protein AAGE01_21630 [Pseudomonadota bacterium]
MKTILPLALVGLLLVAATLLLTPPDASLATWLTMVSLAGACFCAIGFAWPRSSRGSATGRRRPMRLDIDSDG